MIYQEILILFITFLLNMPCHIDSTGLSHCSHVHPRDHEVIRDVFIEPEHLMKKRSIDHPLRIRLYYDTSVYKLDEQKFHVINSTILPEAVHFWEKALMVRKTENAIRLNRKCLNNEVFYRHNDSEPYCKTGCEGETMCGEVVVPRDHLRVCGICNDTGQACTKDEKLPGPGISGADFVLYVSVIQTERCNRRTAVAYAAHCQQEAALDRPIAGYANLCPDSISTKPHELEILLSTVKHEILHALGFSVSLYAFYRDDEGNPMTPRGDDGKPIMNEKLQIRQWSDKVIRTVLRPNWLTYDGLMEREMQMMVTPRVVHEARKHFNCSLLEGAELEDQGVDGTALTHWEKRVFENEAMTGTHTQNPIYSRITLAMMEDTGWYRANYSMAQHLNWGHHLGCDFAMKSCKDWMDSSVARGGSLHPFCNKVRQTPLQTGCTDDRMSLSLCNLVSYSEKLPQMYRNFDTIPHVSAAEVSHYGGSVALADYCPFTQEFTWKSKNVLVRGSRCKYPENNKQGERNFALESYGGRSKCFEHTKTWEQKSCKQVRQWQHWGSGCYEYECRNGRLEIAVGNHTYTCYQQGQQLDIRIMSTGWLQTGGIICPSCEEMCQEEFESRGEKCESDADIPSTAIYHRDELKCEAAVQKQQQQQQRNASGHD